MRRTFILVAGILAVAQSVFAETWTDPETNIEWYYTILPDGSASIGDGHGAVNKVSGDISIPAHIDGRNVTKIGSYSFSRRGFSSIQIPTGVVCVAGGAFLECSSLKRISIPPTVEEIRGDAFSSCTNLGNGVVISGGWVLTVNGKCPENVSLPSSTKGVAGGAFAGCSNLVTISLNRDLRYIGERAFVDCAGLKEIKLPGSVLSVGGSAFLRCSGLTELNVEEGVQNIEFAAFADCTNLTKVSLPTTIPDVSYLEGWFWGCHKIESIKIPATRFCVSSLFEDSRTNIVEATILEGETTIVAGLLGGCENLRKVAIPQSVTEIGDNAFSTCKALTEIHLPIMLTRIGENAFGWSGIGSIDVPDSVVEIGRWAFQACTNLTTVTLPSRLKVINDETFSGCRKLSAISIPEGVGRIGNWAFRECDKFQTIRIPSSVQYIGRLAFAYCSTEKRVDFLGLPPNIEDGAFDFSGNYGTYPTQFAGQWETIIGEKVSWKNIRFKSQVRFLSENSSTWVPSADSDKLIAHGFPIGELPRLSYEGYDFLGWFTSEDGGRQVSADLIVTTNITLYAHWQKTIPSSGDRGDGVNVGALETSTHTVTFDLGTLGVRSGGGELIQTVGEGENAIAPIVTVNDNRYIFTGWDISWTGTRNDLVVHAVYEEAGVSWHHVYEDAAERVGMMKETLSSATTYDGYLYDDNEKIMGTITVKAAKAKANRKTGDLESTVSITAQLVTGKKISAKGVWDIEMDELSFGNGDAGLYLRPDHICGEFMGYQVDGARNIFLARDADSKLAADEILEAVRGAYALEFETTDGTKNYLSISLEAKGRVKIAGTLGNGSKVSASSQLIAGESCCCISIVMTKKVDVSCVLWIDLATRVCSIQGMENAVFARCGSLHEHVSFVLDQEQLSRMLGDATYAQYLPTNLAFTVEGSKLSLPKPGRVTLKGGIVDESKTLLNPSALKLTFSEKSKTFKGSFKAYVNYKGKPKAITVSVVGVLMNDIGYGTATIKNYGSVAVEIR